MTHLVSRSCFTTLAAAFVALIGMSSVYAAETSASYTGFVQSGASGVVSGAEVNILHVPSGVSRTFTTSDSGAFHASGLRVGGPYNITITADGFRTFTSEGIKFIAGSQPTVWIALTPIDTDIPEVVATGSAILETDLHNGVGSSYSDYDIANMPSVTRDVLATLNRDPLAHSDDEGMLNVAGVNPRFNGLAIDGSLQQDDFGLSDNTYASRRSPINLDAIESVALVASDYSVTASGFTGGLVNITTKSGTNEVIATAYHHFQDEGDIGNKYDGDRTYNPGTFDETEMGFTVGFPIIKDKFFAFVSYDEFASSETVDFSNFDSTRGIQPGFFDAMRGVIQDVYGFDPGTRPAIASTPVSSERTLVKLDWNVNDFHRLAFTYQSTLEQDTGVNAANFETAWIDVPLDLKAYTIQFFSDWTQELSTTLRYNVKEFERGQNCRGGKVGHMAISNIRAADVVGTPLEGLITDEADFVAGCDRFRHANAYNDERGQLFMSLDYLRGSHLFKVGFETEHFELFNLFVPSSNGRFVFDGYDDLVNRIARIDYVNVMTNNAADGAAAWSFNKRTFFAQDTWYIRPNLDITYGIRYEYFLQDDTPAGSSTIRSTYGERTDRNLQGLKLWLPRASFRYTGFADTTISGGIGLFSGGDPKVWTSNAFQVPTAFARLDNADNVDVLNVPASLREQVGGAAASVPIDFIAGNFKPPSDWKMSLRVDHDLNLDFLPEFLNGTTLTGQLLSTRIANGFIWTNLAHTRLDQTQPTGVAPDGRPIYADLDSLGILNLTQLGNASGGSSNIISVAATKAFGAGIDLSMSYTYQDIEVVSEGTSSRGISNWRNILAADRNNPSPRKSPYEKTHSLKTAFGYARDFGPVEGRIDVFSRVVTGSRYTFVFDVGSTNPLFGRAGAGESPRDNDPLYIPVSRSDARVVYGSNFDVDGFFNYIGQYDLKGGIVGPFEEDAGLNQFFDLRLQASIPVSQFISKESKPVRLKVILDIENVLNLFNDKWGTYEDGPSRGAANIVQADLISAADLAANGVDEATALTGDAPRTTCLQASDCVYRYRDFDADATSFTSATRSVYEIRLGFRLEY